MTTDNIRRASPEHLAADLADAGADFFLALADTSEDGVADMTSDEAADLFIAALGSVESRHGLAALFANAASTGDRFA